jgi:hypothetical protein
MSARRGLDGRAPELHELQFATVDHLVELRPGDAVEPGRLSKGQQTI